MATKKKRGPGRPKGGGKLGARLELRSSTGEKEDIEAAARAAGLTANEWLRRAAGYCLAVKVPLQYVSVGPAADRVSQNSTLTDAPAAP